MSNRVPSNNIGDNNSPRLHMGRLYNLMIIATAVTITVVLTEISQGLFWPLCRITFKETLSRTKDYPQR